METKEADDATDAVDDGNEGELSSEAEWDAFMLKSIKPGKEDDDNED